MQSARFETMLCGAIVAVGSAHIASAVVVMDPAMYEVGAALNSFATMTDELNIDSTSFLYSDYLDPGDSSGHEVLAGPTVIDRTGVISRAWTVDVMTTFNQGGDMITLNPGDRVFSYTIDMVGDFADSTVDSLREFKMFGTSLIPPPAGHPFAFFDDTPADLILGRGFSTPAAGVVGPVDGNGIGDITELPSGSILDWDWDDSSVANHLQNSESITLLMFTGPSAVGQGYGQVVGALAGGVVDVDGVGRNIPILVPIVIPAPGGAALAMISGALFTTRRRRL